MDEAGQELRTVQAIHSARASAKPGSDVTLRDLD